MCCSRLCFKMFLRMTPLFFFLFFCLKRSTCLIVKPLNVFNLTSEHFQAALVATKPAIFDETLVLFPVVFVAMEQH